MPIYGERSNNMKLLVIGSGGREHAIVRSLKKSPRASEIHVLPGNGGLSEDAICADVSATDIDGAVSYAKEHEIDYAVVTPDDPLCLGMVDALEAAGIPCFGYGPSLESLAHVRDEYIEIDQLTKACKGFECILAQLTK